MKSESGFSLMEVLVVIFIIGLTMTFAAPDFKRLSSATTNAQSQVTGFIKMIRARAIADTSAYVIQSSGNNALVVSVGKNCSDPNMVVEPALSLALDDGATFYGSSFSVCFNSRGFPDSNLVLQVNDGQGSTKQLELMLGGAVRAI